MSDEDRKAFEREMADDTRFFLRNDDGLYRYEDIRLAWESWQSALAWERGRQTVLAERWMLRSQGELSNTSYESKESAESEMECWCDGAELVRVKIVEAE